MNIKNIDKITENIVFDIIFEQIATSKLALERSSLADEDEKETGLTPEEEADADKISDELKNTKMPGPAAQDLEDAIKLAYANDVVKKDEVDKIVQNFSKNPFKATQALMKQVKSQSFSDLYRKKMARTGATEDMLKLLGKKANDMAAKITTDLKTAKVFKGADSLSSKLKQSFPDLPEDVLKQILGDISDQLKANDLLVQEAILEALLAEKKPSRAKRKKTKAKMAAAAEEQRWTIGKLRAGGWYGQRAEGERRHFHQLEYENSIAMAKEAAKAWAQGESVWNSWQAKNNKLWREFADKLKLLNLDTDSGRAEVTGKDEEYLAAYMFYKAMKLTLSSMKKGQFLPFKRIRRLLSQHKTAERHKFAPPDQYLEEFLKEAFADWEGADPSPKGGETKADKADVGPKRVEASDPFRKWLEKYVAIFDKEKLNNATRAAKIKRGVKDTKPDRTTSIKTQKGVINVSQVIGPRLKAAGIDPNTSRGRLMKLKITKMIARFLDGTLQRAKRSDVKMIIKPGEESGKKARRRVAEALPEFDIIKTIAENVFDELKESEIII